MVFEQQAQEDLYSRVLILLREAFGDLAEALDDGPAFVLDLGRGRFLVSVDANGPEKASVMLIGGVGEGIDITPSVAEFLVRRAHAMPLTTLGVSDEDSIMLRQVILGEAVTRENVMMMVRMFSEWRDELDDELTMRFR